MQKEPSFVPKNFIDKNGNVLFPAVRNVPIEMLGWDELYDFGYQMWEFSILLESENNTLKEGKNQLVASIVVVSVILFLGLVWFLTNFWEILSCVS